MNLEHNQGHQSSVTRTVLFTYVLLQNGTSTAVHWSSKLQLRNDQFNHLQKSVCRKQTEKLVS